MGVAARLAICYLIGHDDFPAGSRAMCTLLSRPALKAVVFLGATLAFAAMLVAEPLPLAIRGYDPVAYFTDARPIQGLPNFEYAWDGYRYRFATAAHREQFRADPVRYAPQFEGSCTMALARGITKEADPEHWLISDGKLYLFSSARGEIRFQANPAETVVRANKNWFAKGTDVKD
jgi:YHS domain-containing protein